MKYINMIMAILFLCSCNAQNKNHPLTLTQKNDSTKNNSESKLLLNDSLIDNEDSSAVDEKLYYTETIIFDSSDLACKYLLHFPKDLKKIQKSVKKWMYGGNDICILGLIDTINREYNKTNNRKYLICLDSISTYSDGYISESLMNSIIKILKSNNHAFLSFLSANNFKTNLAILIYYYYRSHFEMQFRTGKIKYQKFKDYINANMSDITESYEKNELLDFLIEKHNEEE